MKQFTELSGLSDEAARQIMEDMSQIARGEELELPWRRLRILFDHDLVAIVTPVITGGSLAGSRTSLGWTNEGVRFMRDF